MYNEGPKSPCSKLSKKAFFTFSSGEASFQQGYLGADEAVVSGVFHLRYTDDKPIFAKKIAISFVGKEYVFFTGTLEKGKDKNMQDKKENDIDIDSDEEDEQLDDDDDNATTLSTHAAKRRIFGTSMVIWRSQNKGQFEELKMLDLPFKFKLPSNLPSSFVMDKGCGRIYYMLKAIISRQPSIDSKVRKKKVKVLVPIVRYTITPPASPSHWSIKQQGSTNPHIVSYDVSLNHSTFGPGNSINIPIKLHFHEPKVYLRKIFVGLKEYHELRTNKYEALIKKYLVEELIDANNLPISASNENYSEYSVDVQLNMPFSTRLVYSVDSAYLTVKHKLKIKISLGKAPDIHLSKFVNVENLVTKDEVYPPPPPKIDIPINPTITPQQQIQQKITQRTPNSMVKPSASTPRKKNGRRLSPFFPLFNKIHILDPVTQKRISLQLSGINDSKNSNVIYNSRTLKNL